MEKTGTASKTAQVKNETSKSMMNKDNLRFKKVLHNVVKKKRKCQNTKKKQFLSFNKFSILENKELPTELDDFGTSKIVKISPKAFERKKKKSNINKKLKRNVGSVNINSSEGIYPEIIRCNKCFKSHFPSRKICKLNMPKVGKENKIANKALDNETIKILHNYIGYLKQKAEIENKLIRLRGGAVSAGNIPPLIMTRAIESAKKHGINLVPGILNKADGNCAFDAALNNINHRNCFTEKLLLSSIVYRQIWVTELEMESSNYPALGAGYTKEEKEENWNQLKQSGVYEVDFFGDMVIHAIARGCNKNILIFNTNIEAADPIYVIQANHFGGFSDTDIPIVIAYNQVHYESLHPLTDQDTEQTKMLMHSYINGTYQYKKKDIPFLFLLLLGKTQKQPL